MHGRFHVRKHEPTQGFGTRLLLWALCPTDAGLVYHDEPFHDRRRYSVRKQAAPNAPSQLHVAATAAVRGVLFGQAITHNPSSGTTQSLDLPVRAHSKVTTG